MGGALGTLSIGGADLGSIAAGSVASVTVAAATPGADGVLFGLTQAGVLRSITATAGSGLVMAVAYDGTADSQSAGGRCGSWPILPPST